MLVEDATPSRVCRLEMEYSRFLLPLAGPGLANVKVVSAAPGEDAAGDSARSLPADVDKLRGYELFRNLRGDTVGDIVGDIGREEVRAGGAYAEPAE